MKREQLRGSGPVKAIAWLLACALAVCVCASAAGGLYLYGQQQYYRNNGWEYGDVEELADQAREYFFLSCYQDALTAAGRSRFNELTEQLSDKTTNFRFEVGRTSNTEILCSNFSGQSKDYDLMNTYDFSLYENAMGRMLAYYVDLSKTEDWEERTGTPQLWAATPNASRYYYDDGTWQEILRQSRQTAEANLVDESNSGGYGQDILDDGATLEIDQAAIEGAQNYHFFVYTGEDEHVWLSVGIDRTYPVEDEFSVKATRGKEMSVYFEEHFYPVLWIGIGAGVLLLALLGYLLWSIGWDKGGTLALRHLNRLPVEIVLGFAGVLGVLSLVLESEIGSFDFDSYNASQLTWVLILTALCSIPAAVGGVTLWTICAAQLKTRTMGERSLLARICRWLLKWLRIARHGAGRALLALPLYWKAAVFCGAYYVGFLIYYFIIDTLFHYHHLLITMFWFLLAMLPAATLLCKWAADWNRLRQAVKEMVSGKLDYSVDTSHMLPDLKSHGEDLSSLSKGLSLALDERIRGERFKTELITNVSHDLKTPLTSIINYVDLLKQSDIQDETARGYIEVLERKSQRLKTLTEDLVEASKAASGTVAVHLERLDMGQLVSQAVAEYDERLTAADLTPVLHLPEQPCEVMADGRHLWRVLDNLLGNCTKYALPGTRVYLDVERQDGRCTITVKNISAEALNIPAEDLMKRFVRGDSARSTEGSGLGLSIARNLTNAQDGTFQLVVDGDLFKAVIGFPLIQ